MQSKSIQDTPPEFLTTLISLLMQGGWIPQLACKWAAFRKPSSIKIAISTSTKSSRIRSKVIDPQGSTFKFLTTAKLCRQFSLQFASCRLCRSTRYTPRSRSLKPHRDSDHSLRGFTACASASHRDLIAMAWKSSGGPGPPN
jgi:hypothetical protein